MSCLLTKTLIVSKSLVNFIWSYLRLAIKPSIGINQTPNWAINKSLYRTRKIKFLKFGFLKSLFLWLLFRCFSSEIILIHSVCCVLPPYWVMVSYDCCLSCPNGFKRRLEASKWAIMYSSQDSLPTGSIIIKRFGRFEEFPNVAAFCCFIVYLPSDMISDWCWH